MNDFQDETYAEYMAREQAEECEALRRETNGKHLCEHCAVFDDGGYDYPDDGTGDPR